MKRYEKRIVYEVPGMSAIKVQSHSVWKRSDNTELILDQYLPAGRSPSTKMPGVLLVHGGPLRPTAEPMPKEWGAFVSYGQLLAASGLIGLMFNHRYFGKQGEQQAGEDIEAVMAYLLTHAEELMLDPTRICVWAFSGAGKLLPIIMRREGVVRSLVLYYTLLAFKDNEALWRSTFAKTPIGVAKAGLDRANINRTLDQLVQQAQATKATLEVWHHAEGHHGFDILDDNVRSREIIAKTLEFIRAHT